MKTARILCPDVLVNFRHIKIVAPIFVAIMALIFSFWLMPIKYVNPLSVGWIFAPHLENLADGAGHAIQAMFYAEEPWYLPPGKLVSFGGPAGASLILAAVSPLLALPVKFMETIGLMGVFWQFIGIQAVLGICLTAIAMYFLGLALGASELASGTVALLSLPLPNLFVVAIFNESLSWQFLAIVPMILLLNDKNPKQRFWPWPFVIGIATWNNTYFVPMIMAFFVVHLWVIRHRYKVTFSDLFNQSLMMTAVVIILHYLGGGFLAGIRDASSSIGWLDLLSVDLADFFHLWYDRQGYVYRGRTVFALLFAWQAMVLINYIIRQKTKLYMRDKDGDSAFQDETIISLTFFTSMALFAIALGPIIHFGTLGSIKLPLPESLLRIMSVFRAVGRFSWPLIYLMLGFSAIAIDTLVKNIPVNARKRSFILYLFCLSLISSQFVEFYPELLYFKKYAKSQVIKMFLPSPALDEATSTSSEIEIVPPYDQDNLGSDRGVPWNSLSYYAIKYHVPIYTYHWLGRYNRNEVDRIHDLVVRNAVECRWSSDRMYVLNRSYLPQIDRCGYQMNEIATYSDWVVLKIKRL